MKLFHSHTKAILQLVIASVFCALAPQITNASVLIIQLPEEVTVNSQRVLLRDIAKISGSNAAEIAAAGALEIVAIDAQESTAAETTAQKIRIRLVLSGFPNQQLQFRGSTQTTVRYLKEVPITDQDVQQAALNVVAESMNVPKEEVRVTLLDSFMAMVPNTVRSETGLRLEVLPPNDNSPGQKNMLVRLWKDSDVAYTKTARFMVHREYQVAVTLVSLTRDQPIDDAFVRIERQFLEKEADEVSAEALRGRVVQKNIEAGSVLSLRDLSIPVTAKTVDPIIIKRRDSVPVIARFGGIEIHMRAAEALQDGRDGDFMQLRNLETKKIFTGKVNILGHVEVQ